MGGIAEFGNDVATLLELQAKLAVLDLKEATARAVAPAVLIVFGSCLALGTFPVMVLGLADRLAVALHIASGWAMLLTSAVVLILALALVGLAAMRLGPSFSTFRRSRDELERNLTWLRTVLLYSGRPRR